MRASPVGLIITRNGRATAVIQDVESHDRQRRARQLPCLLATGDQQLRRGEGNDHAEAMERVRRRLAELADD